MISQLRDPNPGQGCTEKLACKLGDMVRSSSLPSWFISKERASDWMIDIISFILPKHSMIDFARSFRRVIDETDKSSCDQECLRCIKL